METADIFGVGTNNDATDPLWLHDNQRADPKFVDADNDDFRLQSDSPAIDVGFFAKITSATGNGLTWDHMVCAVRHHDWETLAPYLGGVAAIDEQTGTYFQTFSGDISIVDPGEAER